MKPDFAPVRRWEMRLAEWAELHRISREDLVAMTHAMIEAELALLQDIDDTAVTFQPEDPEADDPFAQTIEEMYAGWTLGHVIAHVTASSEETCAHAATLARGVQPCGRNRHEVPWERVRTVAAARHRLEESRRIRLAYLNAWPDEPHYETTYTPYKSAQNCITRVLAGLFHEEGHLEQLHEIIRQASSAREPAMS